MLNDPNYLCLYDNCNFMCQLASMYAKSSLITNTHTNMYIIILYEIYVCIHAFHTYMCAYMGIAEPLLSAYI